MRAIKHGMVKNGLKLVENCKNGSKMFENGQKWISKWSKRFENG